MPFRKTLQYDEYVGLDLEPGEGVDIVANLENDITLAPFDLVICCSVLEHCKDPWKVARNIVSLLKNGGQLYLSVPWVWRYHAYPDDYWRFSFSAVRLLFPDVQFSRVSYSTTRENDFFDAEPEAENRLALILEGRKYLPYCELHAMGEKWLSPT